MNFKFCCRYNYISYSLKLILHSHYYGTDNESDFEGFIFWDQLRYMIKLFLESRLCENNQILQYRKGDEKQQMLIGDCSAVVHLIVTKMHSQTVEKEKMKSSEITERAFSLKLFKSQRSLNFSCTCLWCVIYKKRQ